MHLTQHPRLHNTAELLTQKFNGQPFSLLPHWQLRSGLGWPLRSHLFSITSHSCAQLLTKGPEGCSQQPTLTEAASHYSHAEVSHWFLWGRHKDFRYSYQKPTQHYRIQSITFHPTSSPPLYPPPRKNVLGNLSHSSQQGLNSCLRQHTLQLQ